ncbi:MAG: hypothetical protein L3J20_00235 [Flavobacteriaceae bacterium]|nr:hypothetical protein [Flavobacteriaceae bacterium]
MRIFIGLIVIIVFISACQSNKKSQVENQSDIHKAVVQKVLHVDEYTYLRVLEDTTEKWLAVPSVQAKIGETYYFKEGMKMSNFESKELNKTFETIYFIEKIGTEPNPDIITETVTLNNLNLSQEDKINLAKQATKPVLEKENVKIEHDKGIITVAELYKNKKTHEGEIVMIKGKVTKFNPAIMKKNWIHLQDGTDYNGEFDVTVTTNDIVEVGDVITIEGKVSLDKDFGAGYVYKLIIEDAVLIK